MAQEPTVPMTSIESLGGHTEVGDALAWAEDHGLVDEIHLAPNLGMIRRRVGGGAEEWDVHDLQYLKDGPRRASGTISVHDALSFTRACSLRANDDTIVVYADEEQRALVAVLNDDILPNCGWRDYRVSLALRPTPEWHDWVAGQGLGDQQRFAERMEDGLPEIVEPSGATMLEIAQTFAATIGVSFRSGTRLSSGQTQFAYDEDVKASAGSAAGGVISVPETFKLSVRPFVGAEPFEVTARLRYRLSKGELQIGYHLVRPEEVERAAFADTVGRAESAMTLTPFLRGPAPGEVR